MLTAEPLTIEHYRELATEHVAECNLCRSSAWIPVALVDRAGFPARAVCCGVCGLVQISPRMPAAAYAEFYASGEYRRMVDRMRGRAYAPGELEESQLHYAEAVSQQVAPQIEPHRGGTMLDIGGSTGVVAGVFAERFGLHATVLEPSDIECGQARDAGLETIQGTLDTFATDRHWDVIGLFQTVDHLLDVASSLRRIRSLLVPGGLLIVDIVEFRAMILLIGSIRGAVKIDHPTNLTDITMVCLLHRAGFDIAAEARTTDYRKRVYCCRPGEVRNPLPHPETVREIFDLARRHP